MTVKQGATGVPLEGGGHLRTGSKQLQRAQRNQRCGVPLSVEPNLFMAEIWCLFEKILRSSLFLCSSVFPLFPPSPPFSVASVLRSLRSRSPLLLSLPQFNTKLTVTLITIGTGLPFSSVGVNSHCRTASTAALSRPGVERSTLVSTTVPSMSMTASMTTIP
jgi:hypothetical protein